MRIPTASAMAFAIAAGIASRPISPRPFAPNGPLGSYESAKMTCIFGIIPARRDRVIDEVGIGRRAVVPVEILDHRVADALRDRALHLAFGGGGVDDRAAIDSGRDFEQRHFAGVAIDFDFHRLRREVVGARLVAVAAVIGEVRRVVPGADADDRLPVALVDVGAHDRRDGFELALGSAARADLRR